MATVRFARGLSHRLVTFTLLPVLAGAALIEWDGGGDGSAWGDPLNWVGDALPGAADTVSIGALAPGVSVTMGVSATVSAVTCAAPLAVLPGGALVLNGASTFTALLHIDGGTFTANGTIAADQIDVESGTATFNQSVTAARVGIQGGTATLGYAGVDWEYAISRLQDLDVSGGTLRNTVGTKHELRAGSFLMTGGTLAAVGLIVDGPGAWTRGLITDGASINPTTDTFTLSGPDVKELRGSWVHAYVTAVAVQGPVLLTEGGYIQFSGLGLYLEGDFTLAAGAGGGGLEVPWGGIGNVYVSGTVVLDPSLGINPDIRYFNLSQNATLTLTPTAALWSGGTLYGAWYIEDGAQVRFPAGMEVPVNEAMLQLAGSASFPALAPLHTNRRSIELLSGHVLVTAGNLLNTDGGQITLGEGAGLQLGPLGTGALTLAEGTSMSLSGGSGIHGNVVHAGWVTVGYHPSLDPLPPSPTIRGNLEMAPAAVLTVIGRKVGGAIDSLPLTVTGHVVLAGRLVGGFHYPATPSPGDMYTILRYGSHEGALAPYASMLPYQPSFVLGADEAWLRFGQPLLQVDSEPDAGVSVDLDPAPAAGGTPGVTPFERAYDWSTVITLTAPAVAEDRPFLRWEDGQGTVLGNSRVLTVTLDGAVEVVAVYDPDPVVPGDPHGPFQLAYRDQTGFNLRRIWDLTGQYSGAVGPYALTLDLAHGEKGTLTGTGRLQGTVGGQAFDVGGMAVKGSAKGKAGVVSVKGGLAGSAGSTKVSLKLALTLDPGALTLNGTVTGKIADAVGGSAAVSSAVVLPLPAGMDGTYQLPINLLLDAKGAVTGTGTLTLANGRTVALLAKGKRAGGVTALQFAGDKVADPAFGAVKLKLLVTTYTNGTAHIEAISGKAFGQSLKWP